MYEYRCDERRKGTVEGSTNLAYTGLCGGLEHLKIETRLTLIFIPSPPRFIDERFESVMGECMI